MAVSPERRTRTTRGKPAAVRGVIDVPRTVVGGGQHRLSVLHAQIGDALGSNRHGAPAAAPLPAVGRRRALDEAAGHDQPQVIGAERQAGEPLEHLGDTPVSFKTRCSRGNTSVARSLRPARTKNGAPNGATASSRTAPPDSRPVRMRPRTRSPPARPDSDSSPSIDRKPLQAAVAVAKASAAVGSGVGVPAGRGGVRAAHAEITNNE